MANTYTLISSVTVGSGGAANIEFTSIPATYTDLLIKMSLRSSSSGAVAKRISIRFNGAGTDANLATKIYYGDGTNPGGFDTTTGFTGWMPDGSVTSSVFSNVELYIPNYAGSNSKSLSTDAVMENNTTASYYGLFAGLWSSSSAINAIKIFEVDSNNLVQYSTAYLYGISNA
jgi:hypothetical protein